MKTELKSCGNDRCKHNDGNGKCELKEINLVISCGRSTDYVDVLLCEQEEL